VPLYLFKMYLGQVKFINMKKKLDGKYLGNVGQVFGIDSKIEINEVDCWLNYNSNITLIINGGENKISCSTNLSNLIRKNRLDEQTHEIKKFSVYEFEDGMRYATHLIERPKAINDKAKKEDDQSDLIAGINNMYVTEVVSGCFSEKGNFIAMDKDGYEFFLANGLVSDRNQKLFQILINKIKPIWILVDNQIWGGKWNNKQVSSIVSISENRDFCISFKEVLLRQAEIELTLIELFEEQLKLIETNFGAINFSEQEEKLKRKEILLRSELEELNKQLED
jgi:hypothetical protein